MVWKELKHDHAKQNVISQQCLNVCVSPTGLLSDSE